MAFRHQPLVAVLVVTLALSFFKSEKFLQLLEEENLLQQVEAPGPTGSERNNVCWAGQPNCRGSAERFTKQEAVTMYLEGENFVSRFEHNLVRQKKRLRRKRFRSSNRSLEEDRRKFEDEKMDFQSKKRKFDPQIKELEEAKLNMEQQESTVR